MGNGQAGYKKASIHLQEHVVMSMTDTEEARKELENTWKSYYAPCITKYSKDRKIFVAMGTLCNTMKIQKITNIRKDIWLDERQKERDSVYVEFHLLADIKYKGQCLNIKLCSLFYDKYDLFDDNRYDKYNQYWQQSIIITNKTMKELWIPFLNQITFNDATISMLIMDYLFYASQDDKDDDSENEEDDDDDDVQDEIQEIHVMHNGKIDKSNCLLIAALYNFDINHGFIDEYFQILWQWFISKDLIAFRKETVKEKSVWRESSE